MVLAAEVLSVDHRLAASAAASIHLQRESSVVETALGGFTGIGDIAGVAVLAPEQGIVEWFPDPAQHLDPLAPLASEAVGAGWRVTVLVPALRMGEAHRALRGTPVTLQPWWAEGERVRFGGPEVP
jgi:hypothetical protein